MTAKFYDFFDAPKLLKIRTKDSFIMKLLPTSLKLKSLPDTFEVEALIFN